MKGNDAHPFQDYVQATYNIAKYTSHFNTWWHAPKLFKRSKGGSLNKTMKEEESWGMLPNSQQDGVLELWDGIRTNSQVKIQDDFNLHNQEKRVVSASWMEVVRWT